MREEVEKANVVAEKARGTWDKFRKERDFHRMHHRRVVHTRSTLRHPSPEVKKKNRPQNNNKKLRKKRKKKKE